MSEWQRVAPWTGSEFWAGAMFTFGCAFTALVTVGVVRGAHGQINSVLGVLALYGFLGVWLTFAWRMMRTGLYASPTSIRIYWLHQTRTVTWSQIASVGTGPAHFWGMPTVREAIWIELVDGERVETPIQCRTPRWAVFGLRKNIGPVLSATRFDHVVRQLRQRVRTP